MAFDKSIFANIHPHMQTSKLCLQSKQKHIHFILTFHTIQVLLA